MRTFRPIIRDPRDDEGRLSNLAVFIEFATNEGRNQPFLLSFLQRTVASKFLTIIQTNKPLHKFDYPGFDVVLDKTIPIVTVASTARVKSQKIQIEESCIAYLEAQDWCRVIAADDKAENEAPIIAGGVDMSALVNATKADVSEVTRKMAKRMRDDDSIDTRVDTSAPVSEKMAKRIRDDAPIDMLVRNTTTRLVNDVKQEIEQRIEQLKVQQEMEKADLVVALKAAFEKEKADLVMEMKAAHEREKAELASKHAAEIKEKEDQLSKALSAANENSPWFKFEGMNLR